MEFLVALGSGVGKAAEDGKIDINDLSVILPAMIKLPQALQGLDKAGEAMMDLTEEEADELKQLFAALDIPQEELEQAVEDHFDIVIDMWIVLKKYWLKKNSQ
jgi:hypothetical protein